MAHLMGWASTHQITEGFQSLLRVQPELVWCLHPCTHPSLGSCMTLHCSLHWSWGTDDLKVKQHCHQWVLIPLYAQLSGTNPSAHLQTVKVNHRLFWATGKKKQKQQTQDSTDKKLHNEAGWKKGYKSEHLVSIRLRDWQKFKDTQGEQPVPDSFALSTPLPNLSSAKEVMCCIS